MVNSSAPLGKKPDITVPITRKDIMTYNSNQFKRIFMATCISFGLALSLTSIHWYFIDIPNSEFIIGAGGSPGMGSGSVAGESSAA